MRSMIFQRYVCEVLFTHLNVLCPSLLGRLSVGIPIPEGLSCWLCGG